MKISLEDKLYFKFSVTYEREPETAKATLKTHLELQTLKNFPSQLKTPFLGKSDSKNAQKHEAFFLIIMDWLNKQAPFETTETPTQEPAAKKRKTDDADATKTCEDILLSLLKDPTFKILLSKKVDYTPLDSLTEVPLVIAPLDDEKRDELVELAQADYAAMATSNKIYTGMPLQEMDEAISNIRDNDYKETLFFRTLTERETLPATHFSFYITQLIKMATDEEVIDTCNSKLNTLFETLYAKRNAPIWQKIAQDPTAKMQAAQALEDILDSSDECNTILMLNTLRHTGLFCNLDIGCPLDATKDYVVVYYRSVKLPTWLLLEQTTERFEAHFLSDLEDKPTTQLGLSCLLDNMKTYARFYPPTSDQDTAFFSVLPTFLTSFSESEIYAPLLTEIIKIGSHYDIMLPLEFIEFENLSPTHWTALWQNLNQITSQSLVDSVEQDMLRRLKATKETGKLNSFKHILAGFANFLASSPVKTYPELKTFFQPTCG